MGVSFDVSGLERVAAGFTRSAVVVPARVATAVELNAHDVVRIAQALVRFDSGALQGSIGVDFDADGMGAVIGPTAVYQVYNQDGDKRFVNYGPFVEHGTAPHMIYGRLDPRSRPHDAATYPEPGRSHMWWDGAGAPRSEVSHPGTEAHPFMGPAGDRVVPKFIAEILAIARRG